MQINLAFTYKRKNSTLIPDFITTVNCTLKENCSAWNPIFILTIDPYASGYNYVNWGDSYYFLDDAVYVNNLWEWHCSIDILATCRKEITTAYGFLRYSTSKYNIYVTDRRVVGQGDSIIVQHSRPISSAITYHQTSSGSAGLALHLVIQTSEGLKCYTITFSQLQEVLEYLASNDLGDVIDKFFGGVTSACLKKIYLSPIVATDSVYQLIDIMGEDIGVGRAESYDFVLDGFHYGTEPYNNIPKDWRGNAENISVTIYLPFIGNVSIPSVVYKQNFGKVAIAEFYDFISAQVSYTVSCGTYSNCYTGSFSSLDLTASIAEVSANVFTMLTGAVGGLASTVAGAVSLNPAMIAGGVGAMGGALADLIPSAVTVGSSNGGWVTSDASDTDKITIMVSYPNPASTISETYYGRPYMNYTSLSGVTGYVEGTFKISSSYPWGNEISQMMENGIFIE